MKTQNDFVAYAMNERVMVSGFRYFHTYLVIIFECPQMITHTFLTTCELKSFKPHQAHDYLPQCKLLYQALPGLNDKI